MICQKVYGKRVGSGESFIQEGDESTTWFVVVSGSADVFVDSKGEAGRIFVNTVQAGRSVGEFGLIYGAKR